MSAAGYEFDVVPAGDEAECGMCSRETAPELAGRYAFQKARDVAARTSPAMIVAADTVASCMGRILGKPRDADHAREMLGLLSGRPHEVFTGVCLWRTPEQTFHAEVCCTSLKMDPLSPSMIEDYIETMLWEGKAGAIGFQDGNDWLHIVDGGSPSNVVGLPMERLAELLESFDRVCRNVTNGP